MGVNRPFARRSYPSGPWIGATPPGSSAPDPNPDPRNYQILEIKEIGKFIIMRIKYPNCTNFEGEKIIVFQDRLINVVNMKLIDPHFIEGGSIVARFIPTKEGWSMAERFCSEVV